MSSDTEDSGVAGVGYWTFVDYATKNLHAGSLTVDADAARLFMTLNRSTKLVFYDLQTPVRGSEVSEAGFSLLFVLYQTGEVTMKKLIELSGMSKASVSAIIRTLTADGFVERTRSDVDGRSLRLRLTDSGTRAVERIYPEYNKREHAWAQSISADDRAELLRILTALMEGGHQARRRA